MANETTTIEVLAEFAGETVARAISTRGNTCAFRTFAQARVVWLFGEQQEFENAVPPILISRHPVTVHLL